MKDHSKDPARDPSNALWHLPSTSLSTDSQTPSIRRLLAAQSPSHMAGPPPLSDIHVLEFAGLAPGPFAGMLLADYGASVVRVDRAVAGAHAPPGGKPPRPTPDQLTRRKSSIAVDFKSPAGIALILSLLPHVDVVIDPSDRVFGEAGSCAGREDEEGESSIDRCAHDWLQKGRQVCRHGRSRYQLHRRERVCCRCSAAKDAPPLPPGNILGDFAGGGAVCFTGILLALLARGAERTGAGRRGEHGGRNRRTWLHSPAWHKRDRCGLVEEERMCSMAELHSYGCYECKDGGYMSVGRAGASVLQGIESRGLAWIRSRLQTGMTRVSGRSLRKVFTARFLEKTRAEWEAIFDGTDACVTPVLTHEELEEAGHDQTARRDAEEHARPCTCTWTRRTSSGSWQWRRRAWRRLRRRSALSRHKTVKTSLHDGQDGERCGLRCRTRRSHLESQCQSTTIAPLDPLQHDPQITTSPATESSSANPQSCPTGAAINAARFSQIGLLGAEGCARVGVIILVLSKLAASCSLSLPREQLLERGHVLLGFMLDVLVQDGEEPVQQWEEIGGRRRHGLQLVEVFLDLCKCQFAITAERGEKRKRRRLTA
ncbi:hypothetical protein MRB53_041378 [Persea americana]|nr:hypothetical protein MRB53_041378 [Persea americana]